MRRVELLNNLIDTYEVAEDLATGFIKAEYRDEALYQLSERLNALSTALASEQSEEEARRRCTFSCVHVTPQFCRDADERGSRRYRQQQTEKK